MCSLKSSMALASSDCGAEIFIEISVWSRGCVGGDDAGVGGGGAQILSYDGSGVLCPFICLSLASHELTRWDNLR
jgi:hypothetical protein